MIGVMIGAFLLAWTPYASFALIVAFGDPSSITPGMAVIPSLLAKSSICYNPIIYVALNTQVSYTGIISPQNRRRDFSSLALLDASSSHLIH